MLDFVPTPEAGACVSSLDWWDDMQHDVPCGGGSGDGLPCSLIAKSKSSLVILHVLVFLRRGSSLSQSSHNL